MPRLTRSPSRSSSATRLAIVTLSSIGTLPLDDVIDEDMRRHDFVRRDDADRHDLLGLSDDRRRRDGHDRVEIAGGEEIVEIPAIVGAARADQREIGSERRFEQETAPIDL